MHTHAARLNVTARRCDPTYVCSPQVSTPTRSRPRARTTTTTTRTPAQPPTARSAGRHCAIGAPPGQKHVQQGGGGGLDVCRGSYLEDSLLPAHWSDATPTRKCCRSVLALGRFSPPTATPIWHRGVPVWSPHRRVPVWSPLSGLRQTCTGAAPRDSTPHPTLLARAGDMQPKPRAGVRLHSQSTSRLLCQSRARLRASPPVTRVQAITAGPRPRAVPPGSRVHVVRAPVPRARGAEGGEHARGPAQPCARHSTSPSAATHAHMRKDC